MPPIDPAHPRQRNAKALWKPVARLVITGVALFFVLYTVDVSAALPLLTDANVLYVGLATGMLFLFRALLAWKWQLLLHYAGTKLSLGYLLRIDLVSFFLGFFLPSSVGVDIIRTVAVGRRIGYSDAAVSTIADRGMAIAAMALWSLAAALIALWFVPHLQHVLWPVVALCLGVMVMLTTLLSDTAIRIVPRLCGISRAELTREPMDATRFRRLIRTVVKKAITIHNELRGLLAKPPAFISAFLLNLVFQCGRIVVFYLLFLAVGADVAFLYHAIFAPLVMFFALLPISFFGIGIKEAAVIFFYTQVGVDPASAFAVSVWTYLITMPLLAIGGFLYVLGPSAASAETDKKANQRV